MDSEAVLLKKILLGFELVLRRMLTVYLWVHTLVPFFKLLHTHDILTKDYMNKAFGLLKEW